MAPLPLVTPMAPTLAKPFHRDGWVYEEKYDGWRMIAYKDGRSVRLVSRNGVDHTERFAQLSAAIAAAEGADADPRRRSLRLRRQPRLAHLPARHTRPGELATPPVRVDKVLRLYI